jgi:cytochrome c peroxidase
MRGFLNKKTMRILFLAGICSVIFFPFLLVFSPRELQSEENEGIKKIFEQKTDDVLSGLTFLDEKIRQKKLLSELQQQFLLSRLAYKEIEPVTEYYFPGLNNRINGPALPDVKKEDNQVWPPHGFQAIEQYLYSGYHDSLAVAVSNEIKLLQADLRFVKTNLAAQSISPNHLYELVQHQLIRIAVLGITGFDAPLSKYSLNEAAISLKSIRTLLKQSDERAMVDTQVHQCIIYLETNNDFDSFNRMAFVKDYLMPLSETIRDLFQLKNDSTILKPHNNVLSDLMKGKTFNADYFTAYASSHSSKAKIELGKKLFFDKGLSAGNTISCGSCHQPEKYFTDGLAKANDFVHGGTLQRNTPSVYYSGLQNSQFYDMRSNYLEDQVNEVMNNSRKFNFSAERLIKRLLKNKDYETSFAFAFPHVDSFGSYEIGNAIASFIRSLSPFSSKFDAYMQGNTNAINEEEISGFNLFAGKAKCATCHFIPVFNGTAPPWFNKSESEIVGVPSAPVWVNAGIDGDVGRYNFNKIEEFRFAFKTPTVRNAAETAPYMHNGVYQTLDEVVEFYHRGGGAGIGINLPFQSLPFDSLQLSTGEKKAIVAFMKTLTDKKFNY